jgi:hypothetical protein
MSYLRAEVLLEVAQHLHAAAFGVVEAKRRARVQVLEQQLLGLVVHVGVLRLVGEGAPREREGLREGEETGRGRVARSPPWT